MENMENAAVMNEATDVVSAGTGKGKLAGKIALGVLGVGVVVYGVRKIAGAIKNKFAAKKAQQEDADVIYDDDCE